MHISFLHKIYTFRFSGYVHFVFPDIKNYSGDFMKEVYDLFVREIMTSMEKKNLLAKHPDIPLLLNEYRDGILLFSISNEKIWNKPAGEQKAAEEAWIEELKVKYPVVVNWKAIKKAVKR